MKTKGYTKRKKRRVKSPFRLAIAIILLCALIYLGIVGAVAIITGKPINFAFWQSFSSNTKAYQDFVVAGVDEDGIRTDLIMLCRYNLTDNSINVLQIPRDTKVETDRSDKKINSAYGSPEKIQKLYQEIESITGIRPERYVVINFRGFRELIDTVGGVEINVPMRMYYTDPEQNLTIDLYPGTQVLDGRHAEMFMRFRKNNDGTGYPNGDIDRMAAQKQFYEAALNKLLSGRSIWKAPQLLSVVLNNVKTDFTGEDILRYIGRIPRFSMDKVKIMSLPGEGGYDTNGISYFFHDEEKTRELINQYFSTPETVSQSGSISQNRSVKVKLVDATGIDVGQADVLNVVSETLSAQGFNVVSTERCGTVMEKSRLVNHNDKNRAANVGQIYPGVEISGNIEKYVKNGNEKEPDVTLYMGADFSF